MRTRLIAGLAVLLLCIALPCPALQYYHLRDDVTNTYGTVASGASVYVYTPNTTTTVTAYMDIAGSTAVTWPLTTDSNGVFECYLADGNYDIRVVYANWSVDTTWDNYMVGTGSDSLQFAFAAFDSIRIDGDGTTADLRFGKAGDAAVTGRLFIPNSSSLYVRRSGGTARRQDGGYNYTFGVGGNSVQFEERATIDWVFGDADHATGGYDDRGVLFLDSTYADSTAADSEAYQSVILSNTRADSSQWMMGGIKGARGFWQGTPDYGVRLQTDLPDSNDGSSATTGSRDAVQIRWWLSDGKARIYDDQSSFLRMLEHDTQHYSFEQTELLSYSLHGDEKKISIKGVNNGWTQLKNNGNATELRANTGLLNLRGTSGADNATLDTNKATIDTLKADTHYLRAADGQNDATLDVDNVTLSGALAGARCILGIGSNASNNTTDTFFKSSGYATMGTSKGYVMNRAGSIVGAVCQIQINSYTPVATVELEILVNNSPVYEQSVTVSGTGVQSIPASAGDGVQARGLDTFSAGDFISARIDIGGTVDYNMAGGYIEIQFDN